MSAITNGLNVAGSIGGVAHAVGNLAHLFGGGGWADSLRQATYDGIPFAVEGGRSTGGRRYAVHEYAFRETGWVEDIGRKQTRLELSGYLVENDVIYSGGPVIQQRDALWNKLQEKGPKTIVHPTFGNVPSMVCLDYEFIERKDLGPVIEVRLSLMKAGLQSYPQAASSTAAASAGAASLTGIAALLNFVKSTASAIAAGASVIQRAVSTVVGFYQMGVSLINDVKAIIGAVSTLGGNLGRLFGGGNSGISGSNTQAPSTQTASDLLAAAAAARASVLTAGAALEAAAANPTDSATLGAAAQAFVQAVASSATAPADAIRLVSSLAQYSPAPVTQTGPIGTAMSTMQTAMVALMRRTALAQLAVTMTTYQPSSQQDADSVLGSAVRLIDAECDIAGDAGDDESYQALRQLRQSVVADMTARGADLSVVSAFTFNAPLPSLVLANRIYRDPSREAQLVQQINPRHPLFCPTTFQALSA